MFLVDCSVTGNSQVLAKLPIYHDFADTDSPCRVISMMTTVSRVLETKIEIPEFCVAYPASYMLSSRLSQPDPQTTDLIMHM